MEPYVSCYSHSIGLILSAGLMGSIENNEDSFASQIRKNWIQTIVMMISGLGFQLLYSKACQLEDNPSNVAIIISADVVIIYFMNVIFMGVELNLVALLGSIIVMASVVVIVKSKNSK